MGAGCFLSGVQEGEKGRESFLAIRQVRIAERLGTEHACNCRESQAAVCALLYGSWDAWRRISAMTDARSGTDAATKVSPSCLWDG